MGGDVVTVPKFENGQPLMLACWVVGAWITWDINSYAIVQWPKMTRVLTSSEEEKLRYAKETDVNEVYVRSTSKPMSAGQRSRGKELLPPFESRHCSH
jgi:hypothetical protein